MICCADVIDDFGVDDATGVEVLATAEGLPLQRNAILDRLLDIDVVVFFDDDFLPAPGYPEAVLDVFAAHPTVVAATGNLIADGSRTPGYTVEEAKRMIAADRFSSRGWIAVPHGYGCNLALRLDVVRSQALRLDERLPLYAWSQDIDFTHRIAAFGTTERVNDFDTAGFGI